MEEVRVTAWRKYGHHRLYLNLANGDLVAWVDQRSGHLEVLREDLRPAVLEALARYRPDGSPPPLPPLTEGDDLAQQAPGAALRAKLTGQSWADRLTHWLLRRPSEWDPWRKGLAGERAVGRELRRFTAQGWQVLHSIPLPPRYDIDHLLIGPGGVFTINTKYVRGSSVWVGDEAAKIRGGEPRPYPRRARAEATRAARTLSAHCGFRVTVQPVLVFVGATNLNKEPTLLDVRVYRERELAALAAADGALSADRIRRIHDIARHRQAWRES
ncbi:nuclease-related domain-containing protein [Streptomyces sp. NPDC006879]|uniref:nuclease-related domain-containing protein n=1 Tax=Streptomyces sp. NPDC006879 TaxID=3364767 RepID=UPI003698AE28